MQWEDFNPTDIIIHFTKFTVYSLRSSHCSTETDSLPFLNRHVGDLGNIQEDDAGEVMTTFTDDVITLNGGQSIIGRAAVVRRCTVKQLNS